MGNKKYKTDKITLVIRPILHIDDVEAYDIIALGNVSKLRKIFKGNDSTYFVFKSRFGKVPMLILDTTEKLRDALSCLKSWRKDLNLAE